MENEIVIYITPYTFSYKGCDVTIWGVKRFDLPTGERRYLVSLQFMIRKILQMVLMIHR